MNRINERPRRAVEARRQELGVDADEQRGKAAADVLPERDLVAECRVLAAQRFDELLVAEDVPMLRLVLSEPEITRAGERKLDTAPRSFGQLLQDVGHRLLIGLERSAIVLDTAMCIFSAARSINAAACLWVSAASFRPSTPSSRILRKSGPFSSLCIASAGMSPGAAYGIKFMLVDIAREIPTC